MFPTIFALIFSVVGIKVYKKTSPNGKLTVYLGKRDVVDSCDGIVDPIEGVVLIDNQYLEHRRVFGQVVTTFRYGREEDEVMGLKFSKTLLLSKDQIAPPPNNKNPSTPTPLQEKLLRKLGNTPNVYPFLFSLPLSAPPSVTLQPSESDMGRPLGTEYELKAFIGESEADPGHKRSTVSLRIRKVQLAKLERGKKQPTTLVTKGFTLSPGKLTVEVSLDRDIYYHGEDIAAQVSVTNTCRKVVKNIKVMVMQHCEVTMVNAHYSRTVAHLESREGCPITPGTSLTKVFRLSPTAANNKDKRGIVLDGHFQDEDVNLASSTLTPANLGDQTVGFVVSYSLRVKVNCGTLGGDVTADLPFKLVHPAAAAAAAGLQSTPEPGGLELSGLYPGPYFDLERNPENVSVYVGTHAYLPCYVKQLGNKSVSWIRKSDAHILTVDRFTFIADERFQVLPLGESWTLQIKYVHPRDAGVYECQISTEPKLAFRVELRVMIPSVRMASKEENMFVWEGSQVQLRCILQNTVMDNLGKLIWYKNGEQIDKLDPFTRVNVAFQSKIEDSSIVEIASFGAVRKADAGNYTCSLQPIGSATVTLHVLNGENPAAMHHGKGIPSISSSGSVFGGMEPLIIFLRKHVLVLLATVLVLSNQGNWR